MQTEILATIGPATLDRFSDMRDAGLSGVRINCSHGSRELHQQIVKNTRQYLPDGYIVVDIQGPKIRIGDLPEPLRIRSGDKLTLVTDTSGEHFPATDTPEMGIPIADDKLAQNVRPGHRLFVDDGFVGLKVDRVESGCIHTTVLFGDVLRSRKGINHPDTRIDYPHTMPYDVPNVDFAIEHRVDFIADSFTRNKEDVLELRERIAATGIHIISKIENPEGLNNFDDILSATDAIMIARGDLGVEIDPWLLPEHQKVMIEKCNRAGKPVITATQMLESMIDNPRPNRADVSDVANALYDGSDVIMLSAETSVGAYPVRCVHMMQRIATTVEGTSRYQAKKHASHPLRKLAGPRAQ